MPSVGLLMDLDEKNLETVLALDGGVVSSQTEDFIQYSQAAVNVDDATELEPTQPVQAEPAVAENAPAQAEDGGNTDQIIDEVPPPTKVLLARKWKQSC